MRNGRPGSSSRIGFALALALALALATASCAGSTARASPASGPAATSPENPRRTDSPRREPRAANPARVYSGSLVWLKLEGGFWGLMAPEGNYDLALSPGWHEWMKTNEGKRVNVLGAVVPGTKSFHMWGTILRADSLWVAP